MLTVLVEGAMIVSVHVTGTAGVKERGDNCHGHTVHCRLEPNCSQDIAMSYGG